MLLTLPNRFSGPQTQVDVIAHLTTCRAFTPGPRPSAFLRFADLSTPRRLSRPRVATLWCLPCTSLLNRLFAHLHLSFLTFYLFFLSSFPYALSSIFPPSVLPSLHVLATRLIVDLDTFSNPPLPIHASNHNHNPSSTTHIRIYANPFFRISSVPLTSSGTTKTYTIPQQGMVFAINAPASNHTFDAFKSKAQRPAGVATVAIASTRATATYTLGSHDLATASGSVFSAASVQDDATGNVTDAGVPTTTASVLAPTGGVDSGCGAGSASGAAPTGKTGGAVKSTAGVRGAALEVDVVFFVFNLVSFV
ncbi:hypothetical protein CVT25_013344 [Psilocybe cyanescens]|uniref:Uncharacterized protein n=1 Tax=Psilocybe cyanescens TaxID=93625 RepID=A0A409WT50_PSICY|nr:hypothetical protein CVT25_013344 [Psilocybe cyanescens]